MAESPSAGEVNAVPVVSVVVAVRGNPEELVGLLGVLARQQGIRPGGLDVVVVDNHDHPHAAVQAAVRAGRVAGLSVTAVHEPRPGLSRARNRGIRLARGRFVLVTDPDARPALTWAVRLVEALEVSGAYCAGGRVLPRYTGTAPTKVDPELAKLFAPPVWPDRLEPLAGPYWLVGCNLGIRRDPLPVFHEAFGVRGRRGGTCEDLEFVTRCQRAGLPVVVAPEAVVHRAVHPWDVTVLALLRRGLAHGSSIARLTAVHPGMVVFDSYRLGHVLRLWRQDRVSALVAAARILGHATERGRCLARSLVGAGSRAVLPGAGADRGITARTRTGTQRSRERA